MDEEKIYKLRQQLHSLILSKADYYIILETSEKLDKLILETIKKHRKKENQNEQL